MVINMGDSIEFAIFETDIGNLEVQCHNGFVVSLGPTDKTTCFGVHTPLTRLVERQVNEFLAGQRTDFDLLYRLYGSDFQKKVWQAIMTVPYGEVRSYGDIATIIGNPDAARAVGGATNKAPMLLIIPCHRVVSSNSIGGFGQFIEMKIDLLRREGVSVNAKTRKIYNHRIL